MLGSAGDVDSTENLDTWYPSEQAVDVNASDPSGLSGNVTCTVGPSGSQQTVRIASAQLPYALRLGENGVNTVSCTAENNVAYATTTDLKGQVKIDQPDPGDRLLRRHSGAGLGERSADDHRDGE